MNDHSKGHPVATKASFISGIPKIHHNECGGRVFYGYDLEVWECLKCKRVWGGYQIRRFTDDEIACRFHLRGDKDPTKYVIVWKRDEYSKTMYSTLVPESEADRYERFKL